MARRNKFSLSGEFLFSGSLGQLIPFCWREVLAGDTVQQQSTVLTRFLPMLAPVMHRCTARIHHFYCSMNNLAEFYNESEDPETPFDWEAFITGGPDNDDTQTPPLITIDGVKGNLMDYLGLPITDATRSFDPTGNQVHFGPVAMANFVFNEYFRDQDLVTERDWDALTVPSIAWQKDYFTTCRPTTQRGSAVTLPLGTSAPVILDMDNAGVSGPLLKSSSDYATILSGNLYGEAATGNLEIQASTNAVLDPNDSLIADLAGATGIDPIDFRRAMALQTWAEIRMKYGNRYVEYMRYLGAKMTRPPDRPVYLGGGVAPIQFSEVLQTAPDTSGSEPGVADLYGHGISMMRGNKYRSFFDEHGFIMSFISIRPRAVYQDGIHASWLRRDKEDYHTRELELIGMQSVPIEEVYADPATPGETFGFQDPYASYREGMSGVAGDFNDTLDHWHLVRKYASEPSLNGTWVTCSPSERIFQQSATDNLLFYSFNSIVARRHVRKNVTARIF